MGDNAHRRWILYRGVCGIVLVSFLFFFAIHVLRISYVVYLYEVSGHVIDVSRCAILVAKLK